MNHKQLTIIINTFNSSTKIFRCLNSINRNCKILVIENSSDKKFKLDLEKKYKNLKCYLTNSNLGYAKGNNFGISKVKTKYCLILNPDAILTKNAINFFFNFCKKKKNFAIVGPYDDSNSQSNLIKPYEVNKVKGFAMFLKLKEFKSVGFFDENFFIYCEEIDLCKRLKEANKKIYVDPKIVIKHIGGSSHNKRINYEMELSRNWHWLWSQFYYNKKHNGYLVSLLRFFPKAFKTLIKAILCFIFFNKKKFNIYFHRFSGLINSIVGNKSSYRPKI